MATAATTHRQHAIEFKIAAVKRLNDGEKANDIAKDLKIASSMLYQWRIALNKGKKKKPLLGRPPKNGEGKTPAIILANGTIGPVVGYLKHARKADEESLRTGTIQHLSRSQLLSQLALIDLIGE